MKQHYIKYISSLLLFGSNGIIASFIHLSSTETVFWRTMIGSILLISIFILRGKKLSFTCNCKDFVYVCLSGISMGLSWIFLYEAYNMIGVSLSSLIYYCAPVIVMIISPILFKEKLTYFKIISFAIVLLGIILANGKVSGNTDNIGLLYGIISALAHALMVIFSKKASKINGLENSMLQLMLSFFTVAVYIGIKTNYHFDINLSNLLWIIILGLLNTGFGCYLYFSSIKCLPVQTVSLIGYIEPLSAVILAVVILKETMSPIQILGAAMIILGAFLEESIKKT